MKCFPFIVEYPWPFLGLKVPRGSILPLLYTMLILFLVCGPLYIMASWL